MQLLIFSTRIILSFHLFVWNFIVIFFPMTNVYHINFHLFFFKSFHHIDSCLDCIDWFNTFQSIYLDSKIFIHKPVFSIASLHFHLISNVSLNLYKSFILNSSNSFGLYIIGHQVIFFSSIPYPTKSSLNFINFF